MKEQQLKLIDYLKKLEIDGCITGSALLNEYYEGADVDFFCYSDKAFIKMFYQLYHDPSFQILDKIEAWKASQFMNAENNKDFKYGVQSIKFTFNTCLELNIVRKKGCDNAFSVISSFDMDIITKCWDNASKQYLDLSGDSSKTKIANPNKWNKSFASSEIWEISRILRQLTRCIKYYKRGFNTDPMIHKYIELIDTLQEFQSIFSSENFNEKLKITQENTLVIKQLCQLWLTTHEITDEQLELLKTKVKEI